MTLQNAQCHETIYFGAAQEHGRKLPPVRPINGKNIYLAARSADHREIISRRPFGRSSGKNNRRPYGRSPGNLIAARPADHREPSEGVQSDPIAARTADQREEKQIKRFSAMICNFPKFR